MQRAFLFIILTVFLMSCNDGDVITAQLEFSKTFSQCGNIVFYKTKTDPNESLSLQITNPVFKFEDYFNTKNIDPKTATHSKTFYIDGSKNKFNYRTYTVNPSSLFCNDVPPANLGIITDSSSPTGTAEITGTLYIDDNDGIPTELEKQQAKDKDGNPITDAQGNPVYIDTDGDGLPNYIDADDDGDNVLTSNEKVTYDIDTKKLITEDTDKDGIPDYLDTDDDGDGVLTRDEENNSQDQDPTNDITDVNAAVADYLNPNIKDTIPATAYRKHIYKETVNLKINVTKLTLEELRQDVLDFGTLTNAYVKTITVLPEFK